MKVKDLSFVSLYAAMAVILDYISAMIPFLQMPQGGSINLAVIPVVVASFHLSWKKGILVGFLWWLLGVLLGFNNWYLNPMQYLLDYLFPMMICGIACVFPKIGKTNYLTGSIGVMILRFLSFLLSGVYFWPPKGDVAGSVGAWIYSLSYNAGYNFATLILAVILVPLCIKRLKIYF